MRLLLVGCRIVVKLYLKKYYICRRAKDMKIISFAQVKVRPFPIFSSWQKLRAANHEKIRPTKKLFPVENGRRRKDHNQCSVDRAKTTKISSLVNKKNRNL